MIRSLAITGPTASGKTALSLALARHIDAEIISCDSMQVYKEMDIGTAKATERERAEIAHHVIDLISPTEDFSAEAYRALAIAAAEDISGRGKIPMLVGGTGLYIDHVMRTPSPAVPESSREFRDALLANIKSEADKDALWQRLYGIDPISAEAIHKNNVRRVARAIEIYERTGKPKSYFDSLSRAEAADITVGMITLDFHNRENLYSRVDRRVSEMIDAGLVSEVRSLYQRGLLREGSTAAQAIGYKETLLYVKGEITLSEAEELIKLSTRRYAKRQLTWFRHETDAYRLYLDTECGVMRDFPDVLCEAKDAAKNFIKDFINEGTGA